MSNINLLQNNLINLLLLSYSYNFKSRGFLAIKIIIIMKKNQNIFNQIYKVQTSGGVTKNLKEKVLSKMLKDESRTLSKVTTESLTQELVKGQKGFAETDFSSVDFKKLKSKLGAEIIDLTESDLTKSKISRYKYSNIENDKLEVSYVDFSHADLSSANLMGIKLTNVNFSDANLSKTELCGSKLRGVNFTNANLAEAELQGTRFINVNLENAVFTGADLENATFEAKKVNRVDLKFMDLSSVEFKGACLCESEFIMCDLKNLNMSLNFLSQASFENCKMTGIVIENNDEVKLVTFNKIDASGANFSKTILQYCKFKEVNLEEANLSETCLTRATFDNVNLQGGCLRGAVLRDAKLSNVNLEGADLTDANLSGASFEKVNFSGAKLVGVIEATFSDDKFEQIVEDYRGEDGLEFIKAKVNTILCLLGDKVLSRNEEEGQGNPIEELEEAEEMEEEVDEAGIRRREPIEIELEEMLKFNEEEIKDVPLSDDQIKEMLGFSDTSQRSSAHQFLSNLIFSSQEPAIIEQLNILIAKIEEVEDRIRGNDDIESWMASETAESLGAYMMESDDESEVQGQKRKREEDPPMSSLKSLEGKKIKSKESDRRGN